MKKILQLIVLFSTILCMVTYSHAQRRGALANAYASWFSVTQTGTTVTFPFNTRDLSIHNGDSSTTVCVDLRGNTISDGGLRECVTAGDPNTPFIFELTAGTAMNLRDYVTGAITLKTISGTASPISVIATY